MSEKEKERLASWLEEEEKDNTAAWTSFRALTYAALNETPEVPVPADLTERIAGRTYARVTLWERLVAWFRPAPVRTTFAAATALGVGVFLWIRQNNGTEAVTVPDKTTVVAQNTDSTPLPDATPTAATKPEPPTPEPKPIAAATPATSAPSVPSPAVVASSPAPTPNVMATPAPAPAVITTPKPQVAIASPKPNLKPSAKPKPRVKAILVAQAETTSRTVTATVTLDTVGVRMHQPALTTTPEVPTTDAMPVTTESGDTSLKPSELQTPPPLETTTASREVHDTAHVAMAPAADINDEEPAPRKREGVSIQPTRPTSGMTFLKAPSLLGTTSRPEKTPQR